MANDVKNTAMHMAMKSKKARAPIPRASHARSRPSASSQKMKTNPPLKGPGH